LRQCSFLIQKSFLHDFVKNVTGKSAMAQDKGVSGWMRRPRMTDETHYPSGFR
jgi:hypothetical protein